VLGRLTCGPEHMWFIDNLFVSLSMHSGDRVVGNLLVGIDESIFATFLEGGNECLTCQFVPLLTATSIEE
jgi:hypothetical protein